MEVWKDGRLEEGKNGRWKSGKEWKDFRDWPSPFPRPPASPKDADGRGRGSRSRAIAAKPLLLAKHPIEPAVIGELSYFPYRSLGEGEGVGDEDEGHKPA